MENLSNLFFEQPILNSPYEYPSKHWELDEEGQPTQKILPLRRSAKYITPIPKPRKKKNVQEQELVFDEGLGISTKEQQYEATSTIINELRSYIDSWRKLKNPNDWMVSPVTIRLLEHWRNHKFNSIRPFFCQIEALETIIWLTEVAPKVKVGKKFLKHLKTTNQNANPQLYRIALKLATGAGKTTVMAMIIIWQTINAVRRQNSKLFTNKFLIITPGITIKDRLRVLQPNDPDSYYQSRELIPIDMALDLQKAKIIITNYHAFKLKETLDISSGGRSLLQGRGEELQTIETPGQMVKRVMSPLMGKGSILVLNDEAHHCYREKPEKEEDTLSGDEKREAEKNNEAARLWISGIEMVKEKLGVSTVVDLSATPFFLSGSGYAEGTLFPWTMSDFSLMDAIECGIVKLPRVPVADNISSSEMPRFRNLWEHIKKKMPKKGRSQANDLDPLSLPVELQTALEALYGHYKKTFELWESEKIVVPPCFIVVCNNTSTSKLIFDFISGFHRETKDGEGFHQGRLELFRNFDEHGNQLEKPRTLLIDSEQLESGEGIDKNFREAAKDEIERFRREIRERGEGQNAEKITDEDLLREVMNTVGKVGRLGESIRCVVSVSMLTEGWDANTVTHVLGVRAFGTQLLCEQVIGRALRRQSYDLNEHLLFNVEYADILGIPFDFTAEPVVVKPRPPVKLTHIHAVSPDRNHLAIEFPRVSGYRVELPEERLKARFTEDSVLEITPELVGPSITKNQGIIGEGVDLSLQHLEDTRRSTVLFYLARRLIFNHWRDPDEEPKMHLFTQLKRIAKEWLDTYLVCRGGTYPAQLLYQEIADIACEKITAAITREMLDKKPIKAILDPYNPKSSTRYVNFNTSKKDLYETDARKCHLNYVVLDSDWEGEFCRIAETHPKVISYVKNQNLGFEVPYRFGSENRVYLPDFIVLIENKKGEIIHLVVEIKGYRREDAKEKKSFIETYWIPGVNHLGSFGKWTFAEFRDNFSMEEEFKKVVDGL
ncbi:MAG: DEAD/DEAH box helicase family protein [Leptospiraceae bacterium]|nr:DEAD/DEAH box helicase family protein [Leptospiraceae bacterium]